MKKIICILFYIINCASVEAQFIQIPTNTNEILKNFVTVDGTMFIQNYGSLFLKSDDSFNTFVKMPIPSDTTYINKLFSVSNKLYLLSSDFNSDHTQFWVSSNKGITWVKTFDTIGFNTDDFIMFDTLNGATLSGFYNMYLIGNEGLSWTYKPTSSMGGFFIKKFSDSFAIWTSPDYIYGTYNRFNTSFIRSFNNLLNPMNAFILNPDTIFLTSLSQGNYFIRLTDSLVNYQAIETSPFSGRGMYFFNGQEGYIVGRDYAAGQGAVFKTTDMGQSWTKYYTGIDCILQDIVFLNDSIALITGTNGVLLKWNKHSVPNGVWEYEQRRNFSISPNPFLQNITVTNPDKKEYSIQLVNVLGSIMFKKEHILTEKYTIDMSMLTSGCYFYSIKEKNGYVGKGKLVKE